MDNKNEVVELGVKGLNYAGKISLWKKLFSSDKQQYHLILSKKDEANKCVPIIIGECEGQAIAIALEKLTPSRPLTHDLFKTAVDKFNYKLDYVLITKVDNEGIFHSTIYYSDSTKKIDLDARLADAIALALRHCCSIYMDKATFEQFSVNSTD